MSDIHAKDASLKMVLKTNRGFRSESDVPAVSAAQWAAIVAITEESDLGRKLTGIAAEAIFPKVKAGES